MSELAHLTSRFAQNGTLRWIAVRPARRAQMQTLDQVEIGLSGLIGDHRSKPGKRAVSLLQWEHLPVIAGLIGQAQVDPCDLRRNLLISGVNLLGLRKRRFQIGDVILQGTGLCAPCSRMEETLGGGGYSAVRGHGGITAEVLQSGAISVGDAVVPIDDEHPVFA